MIYKKAVCARKFMSTSTFMPLVTSNLILPLPHLETPILNYICFQMEPLRSISYYVSVTKLGRIWVYLDPFIPKSVESGDRVQTALENKETRPTLQKKSWEGNSNSYRFTHDQIYHIYIYI